MVALKEMQSSNARLRTDLPGLVAVFVGATSGIGEYTLLEFAKLSNHPKVYFTGRSQEAGDRISEECKRLNPEGKFIFIKADTGLLKTVDDVCRDIKSKENAINLLFLTQGTLRYSGETSEGLSINLAVTYYARLRFIANLLPLLSKATNLRRVVQVFTATKEGIIYADDFKRQKIPLTAARGHLSSMMTFANEVFAKQAPEVAFIHNFPGFVDTNLARSGDGAIIFMVKWASKLLAPFFSTAKDECGQRHVYFATSARYPARGDEGSSAGSAGVGLEEGLEVARGTDGKAGSGVYSIGEDGESSGESVEAVLAKMRGEGVVEKLWEHTLGEFNRITGSESI